MLRQVFGQFGEIVRVSIPVGKGCGFVQFRGRASAEGALQMLQGRVLGRQPIRISLSWERSRANEKIQPARRIHIQQQRNGSYYGYGYANIHNYNAPNAKINTSKS